jgi:hypothetical protein
MGLAQAWRRRGIWATAVTLVLPAAMVLAVATAILGGGFRGLGAVGQLVTGPEVPEASLVQARTGPAHGGRRLPTVPTPSFDAGPASAAPAAAAAGGGGVPAPAPPRASVPPRVTSPSPGAGAPAAAPAQPASPPAAQPDPGPSRPPSPVRQTGEAVAGAVGALPAPAGPLGHDVVTTVLDIVAPGRAVVPSPQP